MSDVAVRTLYPTPEIRMYQGPGWPAKVPLREWVGTIDGVPCVLLVAAVGIPPDDPKSEEIRRRLHGMEAPILDNR